MVFEGQKFILPVNNGIPSKQKETLQRIIKKHGGVIVDDINDCDVVVSSKLTISKKPVVEPTYISKCIEEDKLLSIDVFLVKQKCPASLKQQDTHRSDTTEEHSGEDGDYKKSYICFKKCFLNGPNEDIVKQLMIIKNHRYVTGNSRSELSYSKVISGLRSLPHRIKSSEQVFGMGPKITAYISAFWGLERCQK